MAPEEVNDVLVGLLDGSVVGRRAVDRDPQAYVAGAGVAGVAPRRAIAAEVLPQGRDVEVAQPDEERKTHATDEAECLG